MMNHSARLPGTVDALIAKYGDVQVMPVSFAQQRFFVLDQIEGGAAYTIPVALRLSGMLDTQALRGALQVVVARHEALRTLFAVEGDDPMQVVLPSLEVALTITDYSSQTAAERERSVEMRAAENANAPFDLAAGPLFRAELLRLAANDHVLLLSLHHIVADGWSVGVLFRELEIAYGAELAATAADEIPALLPELPLQYPDFAVWQRRVMQGAAAARQIDYWTRTLANVPALELPSDRPRAAMQSAAGGKRELEIPADVAESIRALGRKEGATPYMTFLAAFLVLLHRYTMQTDIAVGSITSGRQRAEVESLIGLFVNTLALRFDVGGDPSFTEVLRRVRERATEAYANQDVPFERIVDAVSPARDRSRSPIFQVAFQLLEGLGRDLQLPGVVASRVSGVKETTKFDLTLMLHAAPAGASRAVIEFSSALFDPETVDRMLAQYTLLLRGIAQDPECVISRLPMLPEIERQRLLHAWNNTHAAVPAQSLHGLILEQAARTPTAIAVESDGADGVAAQLTFAELSARALALASHLRTLGAGPGTGVGICIERSTDLVVALVAVLASGSHYVPLDPSYPPDRVAYMLSHSEVPVLITNTALQHTLPLGDASVTVLNLDEWSPDASAFGTHLPASVDAEDLAYVIYTSGSTGRPKGVMIPHRAVVNYVHWMRAAYPMDTADAVLQKAPASFDACIWEFFVPLATGARLVLARPGGQQDADYLAGVVQRRGVTILQLVPSQLLMMLETPAFINCTSLRHVFCGGEALPGDALGRLAAVLPHVAVTNLYGPTETTVYSTHWTLDRASFDGSAPIGKPIFNTQVYILDAHRQPTPVGVPGELCIAGRGVARGYYADPELSDDRFVPDPFSGTGRMYRTGDLARWRADGTLEYFGRADHQVKLRGFRIELGEIETVLAAQPDVQAAVAIVREDTPGDKRLVAYVVPQPGVKLSVTELRSAVGARLPEFMVPSAIVFLDALPVNANGKLDRRALPSVLHADASERVFVAPRTRLERDIAGVWAAVLGVPDVSIDDDFFSLGGHSLLAMRVIARLANILPVRLTIGALFEARTVAAFAALALERMAAAQAAADEEELALMLAELDAMSDADAARLAAGDAGDVQ